MYILIKNQKKKEKLLNKKKKKRRRKKVVSENEDPTEYTCKDLISSIETDVFFYRN
jgi:hypothetical protein